MPDDVLAFIGRAPGIGRPRREKLVEFITEEPAARERLREALAAANTGSAALGTSDARFDYVLKAATSPAGSEKPRGPRPDPGKADELAVWPQRLPQPLGKVARGRQDVRLTVHGRDHAEFAEWLFNNGNKAAKLLLAAYEAERGGSENGLAAANAGDERP